MWICTKYDKRIGPLKPGILFMRFVAHYRYLYLFFVFSDESENGLIAIEL